MRKLLLAIVFAVLSAFDSQAQLTGTLTNGLVAFWPLNGSVNDESGNGNDGIISGKTNFASGLVGQAFDFDGETRIVVNDSASLDPTNAITLSAWFNANNWNGNPRILCNGQSIDLDDEFGNLGFIINVGASYDAAVYTALPSTGVWHHVAATYDGTLETLYVDGTNMASQVTNGPIAYPGPPLFNIGAKVTQLTDSTPTAYFDGMIENVCVYNRALSAQEISNLVEIQSFGLGIVILPTVTISGLTNQTYAIQYTTNLSSTNWITLVPNIVLQTSPYLFTDTNALGQPQRYYRAVAK